MLLVLQGIVAVAGFLLATWVGTPAVKGLIRHVDRAPARKLERADEPQIDTGKLLGLEEAGAQLRGGEWIGVLERAAVYVLVLIGSATGLAVVLAIKALGRYADLRTPNEARGERFIIGTFASMLWASGVAGLVMLGQWGLAQLW